MQMARVSAQPLCGLQMLRYKDLMQQLEIGNLRELEDLLITECFYGGIISGKLDQRAGCLHVHSALGRDVQPQQLHAIRHGLERVVCAPAFHGFDVQVTGCCTCVHGC